MRSSAGCPSGNQHRWTRSPSWCATYSNLIYNWHIMRRQSITNVNGRTSSVGSGTEARTVARSAMTEKQVRRPQSLADRAFGEIEEMIVGGALAPGALISESELSRMLKMGRTPIREAIARLKFIGFVDVHSRKGISVSGVDVIRHLEVLEVRRPLEETVALHAIERATQGDFAEL